MNLFFHENFMLPNCTFLAVLVTQIPVCFNKKFVSYQFQNDAKNVMLHKFQSDDAVN